METLVKHKIWPQHVPKKILKHFLYMLLYYRFLNIGKRRTTSA